MNETQRKKLGVEDFQKASQGLYFLLIVALLYSFFMITITNILLLVLGLVYLSQFYEELRWSWIPVGLLMLGFVPYLQGLLLSEETDRALREVQHNLAYLSLPLAMIILPPLTIKQRNEVFCFFIMVMLASTVPVLFNYASNFDEILAAIGRGQAVPTPIDHVRYSVFMAIGCVFSLIGYLGKNLVFGRSGRRFYLIAALYLFIVLHILAVRSGIVLSYVGLFLSGFFILWKARKYLLIGLITVVIAASPFMAYFAIPSFHKKIHYTMYDYGKQQAGQGANYSDSERMRSYRIGLDIWKDHKLLGIGSGDLQRELNSRYQEAYPEGGRALLPHNEFLKVLTTSGLVGLTIFLISVYLPFFIKVNVSAVYLIALLGLLSVSFMVEATLERSYMLNLYLLLAGLLYRGRKS